MIIEPRFEKAADSSRTFGSHRYDVFGPKIGRMLALFGQTALRTWTVLESDPLVHSYCERPIVLGDARPKRVVDFWVRRKNDEELWFLLHKNELQGASHFAHSSAFGKWCTSNGFRTKFIDPTDLTGEPIFYENWGSIIRYLSFNKPTKTSGLVEEIVELTQTVKNLALLENHFPHTDPTVVRTALFTLVHRGVVNCLDIRTKVIGPDSKFTALP